jgi:hypothetical protein
MVNDDSGFAGAVRPQQSEDFAGANLEIDGLDGGSAKKR